jgi:O-antigen ligase
MRTTLIRARPALSTARHRRRAARSTADGASTGAAAAVAAAAVPFTLVVGFAAFDGGYYAPAWGWSALALAWATLVATTGSKELRPGTHSIVWACAVAALGLWIWLSGMWSVSSTLTLLDAQRVLVYVSVAAFVVITVTPRNSRAVLRALLVATAIVATYAVIRYGSLEGTPIAEPVGYANALGLLAVIGLLLALGFAAENGLDRAVGIAAAFPVAACGYLTYSRGPLLAFAVGLATMGILGGGRLRTVAVSSAVVGGVLLAALAGRTALVGSPLGTTLREDVLTFSSNDRDQYWAAAWQTFLDHPLLGSGAGTFQRMWLLHRDVNLGVLDAHSLYLETLAELGPIGLALLMLVCGLPVLAALQARAERLVPAAAGAYAAYLSHSAIDWDWEMPVLTVPAFVLGGILVVTGSRKSIRLGTRERAVFGVAVSLVGVVAFVGLMSNSALTAAVIDLESGSTRSAEHEARRARPWALWSAEPDRLTAEAAVAGGDRAVARRAALAALRRDPGNVRLWRLLAGVAPTDRGRAYRQIAALDPHGPPPWAR